MFAIECLSLLVNANGLRLVQQMVLRARNSNAANMNEWFEVLKIVQQFLSQNFDRELFLLGFEENKFLVADDHDSIAFRRTLDACYDDL